MSEFSSDATKLLYVSPQGTAVITNVCKYDGRDNFIIYVPIAKKKETNVVFIIIHLCRLYT